MWRRRGGAASRRADMRGVIHSIYPTVACRQLATIATTTTTSTTTTPTPPMPIFGGKEEGVENRGREYHGI